MGVAAAALAVLCAADLCGLLIIVWAGGVPWSGLTWIAMIGLPLTFLLLGAALILAIRRRRSL
jgi:LPXTG-motif cell wall-anchored protein